jgi:hypothetical protein
MQNAECRMQNKKRNRASAIRRTVLFLVLLGFLAPVHAEELPADTGGDTRVLPASDDTHPIYSADAKWVGNLVVAAAGLFLAAMVIGPIVRAEAPDAVPVAMSHEEDPAADRVH